MVRESWNKKREFLLACIGYAVGLGNIWRFPYLCFKSGGGAFLLPYFIMLILCGIPLLYMEMAIGQLTRFGPIQAFELLCPLMKGVGLATIVISFILSTYYNVIITWALYYLFNTFQSVLPWSHCNSTWNSDNCQLFVTNSRTDDNTTKVVSATQDFFDRKVLNRTSGIEEMGNMNWQVFGCFILAWCLCYFCVFKGIKSAGKVVYFTATFPYLILIILLISSATLPGASAGVIYFITPVWKELLNVQVWVKAAAQIFNSIGIGFGSLIAFSSYNRRDNKLLKDTLIIALINSATSILAGFVVFCALGHMTVLLDLPIQNVTRQGPELVFVVYPQIFSNLPAPHFWAIAFFVMLICLGIDSQFAMVEVVNTCLTDAFNGRLLKFFKRKEFLVLFVCGIAFLLGIPNLMEGGIYVFTLLDHYTAVVALMFIAFCEIVTVCWIYGGYKLARDVERVTGAAPSPYFFICWLFFAPVLVGIILLFSIIDYKPAKYGKYTYPAWADGLGWLVACCSMICIPVFAAYKLYSLPGNFVERLRASIVPSEFVNESKEAAAVELMSEEKKKPIETPPPVYTSA